MIANSQGLPKAWDEEADLVVLGSGGAALAGAVTGAVEGARVVVLEKTAFIGGTTSVSGGGFWVPGNRHTIEVGVEDSPAEALTYLRACSGGCEDDDVLVALAEHGPPMIELLEDRAGMAFRPWPSKGGTIDYRPELPGSKHGGRTLDAGKFMLSDLGEWGARIRIGAASAWTVDKLITYADSYHALPPDETRPRRSAGDPVQDALANGTALIAQLMQGCLSQGVTMRVNAPGKQLLVEDGRVVGVRAERDGKPWFVRARHGVLVATGGFAHNEEMKRLWLDRALEYSCEIVENQGDGHMMGMAIGAQLGGMGDAWWQMQNAGHRQRYVPHTMVVNDQGRRFCDDSLNYYDFGHQFGSKRDNPGGRPRNLPAWMIFDHQAATKYQVIADVLNGWAKLQKNPAAASAQLGPMVLTKADTLGSLAERLGIDAGRLKETVERFNGFARDGHDADFHRGESQWSIAWGDPNHKPNPSLGTVEQGPFYALEIQSGALATRGGLRVNGKAQVLSAADGAPIPGLYAAGNSSNGFAPLSYPGPGATIGAGMTFGYIAAQQVAAEVRQRAKAAGVPA